MKNSPSISIIIALLFATITPCFSEVQNLNEVMARKARQNTNTFYSGESAGYVWQPQTLQYIDVATGHEVWKITNTPSIKKIYHDDISLSPWSADGAKLAYASKWSSTLRVVTNAYTGEDGYEGWFIVGSDGSSPAPITAGPARINEHMGWFPWSPITPDTYYMFGRVRLNSGVEEDKLYESTLGGATTEKLHFNNGLQMELLRNAFSPDGMMLNSKEFYKADGVYNLYPISISGGIATMVDIDGHSINRPHDTTYWGNSPATWSSYHGGEMYLMKHADGYWAWVLPSSTNTWFKFKTSGSAADGGADHSVDHTSPYDFGETIPINAAIGTNNPWPGTEYWSHFAIDRWGRYALYSAVDASPISSGIEDTTTHTQIRSAFGSGGAEHHDWHAWSDWFVSSRGPNGNDFSDDFLYTAYFDSDTHTPIAYTHTLHNNSGTYAGASYEYNAIPRPAQSPDGTKVAYHSTFTQEKTGSYDDKPDLFYAVAYYPHPPEIVSVSNGVVRFDWRTDQAASRGYTKRGWPNELIDDPPPPRETSIFRLWKSSDGITGWTPVGTVNADIFSRYNFATGVWTGEKYWEITDTDPSGYYAVTSVEHSGLESRTLSNVFSAVGVQTAAYPSDPKSGAGITSSYNSTLKRYYNIYAKDGSTPAISQQTRIASIPVSSEKSYIDWLGNTDGTTKYVVTAVDTQGNESGALTVSFAGNGTAGQYLVTWNESEAPASLRHPLRLKADGKFLRAVQ